MPMLRDRIGGSIPPLAMLVTLSGKVTYGRLSNESSHLLVMLSPPYRSKLKQGESLPSYRFEAVPWCR
jgi:hypothetical protein